MLVVLVNNIKEIYGGSNLLHRIHLLLGIANALVYEYDTETSKKSRQQYLSDSLHHLNESIRNDEKWHRSFAFLSYWPSYGKSKSIKTADAIMRVAAYARKKLWEEKERKRSMSWFTFSGISSCCKNSWLKIWFNFS